MNPTFNIQIIGDRITPGFRSTRSLLEARDLPGIQALAVKQAQAGAAYLDVTIGPRALEDTGLLADVVRAIQDATDLPLCFDSQDKAVQRVCFEAYDPARAGGRVPLVNSITEHRWDLMELASDFRFKVILMTSERVEDGSPRPNKTAEDTHSTCRRCAGRLFTEYGLAADDIYLDMSVAAVVADTEGLNWNTLEAITRVREDPMLKGVHMTGGVTNLGQQLPPLAFDGSDLRYGLECAFLTLAVPRGFDTVLGTPWRNWEPLPEDNPILQTFVEYLQVRGTNALRVVRKFYRSR
jgi:5-methyltetrahydrofolate--homocysteine methyltransferase